MREQRKGKSGKRIENYEFFAIFSFKGFLILRGGVLEFIQVVMDKTQI
jgi:hypothetical protein